MVHRAFEKPLAMTCREPRLREPWIRPAQPLHHLSADVPRMTPAVDCAQGAQAWGQRLFRTQRARVLSRHLLRDDVLNDDDADPASAWLSSAQTEELGSAWRAPSPRWMDGLAHLHGCYVAACWQFAQKNSSAERSQRGRHGRHDGRRASASARSARCMESGREISRTPAISGEILPNLLILANFSKLCKGGPGVQ